jgi:ubiquitin-protein ligase
MMKADLRDLIMVMSNPSQARHRLDTEMELFQELEYEGVEAKHEEGNIMKWTGEFCSTVGSDRERTRLKAAFEFTEQYPATRPVRRYTGAVSCVK